LSFFFFWQLFFWLWQFIQGDGEGFRLFTALTLVNFAIDLKIEATTAHRFGTRLGQNFIRRLSSLKTPPRSFFIKIWKFFRKFTTSQELGPMLGVFNADTALKSLIFLLKLHACELFEKFPDFEKKWSERSFQAGQSLEKILSQTRAKPMSCGRFYF